MTGQKPEQDEEELSEVDRLMRALVNVDPANLPVEKRKQFRKLKRDVSILQRRESGVACSHCLNGDHRDGSPYCDECEALNECIESMERDEEITQTSKSPEERREAAARRMKRQGGPNLSELRQEWKRRKYK